MLPWHCCGHGCLIEAASFIGPQPRLPACWCRHRQCHAPACEAASGLLPKGAMVGYALSIFLDPVICHS